MKKILVLVAGALIGRFIAKKALELWFAGPDYTWDYEGEPFYLDVPEGHEDRVWEEIQRELGLIP
jgi:hypothetical protein